MTKALFATSLLAVVLAAGCKSTNARNGSAVKEVEPLQGKDFQCRTIASETQKLILDNVLKNEIYNVEGLSDVKFYSMLSQLPLEILSNTIGRPVNKVLDGSFRDTEDYYKIYFNLGFNSYSNVKQAKGYAEISVTSHHAVHDVDAFGVVHDRGLMINLNKLQLQNPGESWTDQKIPDYLAALYYDTAASTNCP